MSSFLPSVFGGAAAPPTTPVQCSVCLTPVQSGESFTDPSGCGHLLHLKCFMQTHNSLHSSCPTCRKPFQLGTPAPSVGPAPPSAAIPLASPVPPFGSQRRSSRSERSAGTVPPEEPLLVVERQTAQPTAADTSATTSATTSAEPVIEITTTPEVPAVAAGEEKKMYVNVSTISHENEALEKSRVGVDLVMILDKSGSMGGEKEKLLRNAVEFVIGELDERDRLCTVAFDTRAHYEHGLINMNAVGRDRAVSHARGPGLRSGGGTDIYNGMQAGVAALNARKVPNAVTTIFLLTDGIDDRNLEEKLALARHARSMGWFLYIFAFGGDHNAAHLNTIAEAADSSYIFIDNLATVREAFGGAIGSQQGVAGKLLNLTINAADESVQFHRVASGQYSSNISADRRMAIISYPNLLIGEKRDCCIELTIPRTSSDTTVVFNANLTYTPASTETSVGGASEIRVSCSPCIVARPALIETPLPRNIEVDAQINRITGVSVIERASALADSNNLEEARRIISEAQTEMSSSVSSSHASTQAMVYELTECLGRLQTRREWDTIGRSEQMESCNIHKTQRGVYSKKSRYTPGADSSSAVYSNSRSKQCQSKASFF